MGGTPRVILVLGAARSGKSLYAREIGEAFQGKRLFVATAQALDREMAERIENHRRERGDLWETREEPLEIARVLSEAQDRYSVVLIDCLTLWVSNLLMTYREDKDGMEERLEGLVGSLKTTKIPVVLVSNEVGWGVVPENPLARSFRDLAGRLNQRVAQAADRVVLMVAGIPLVVKDKG
ncbi:MAG: bifunctional adenosylcobinamide kinase/adenosylcobinamide-phosphate guanylyltransferase [Deltaproteobacteria bacterium]|nr:bifunctional adenosylcobinamide kinase/adenosylcobinamide-phosphate guanylyltransferase [Deltaproteobacteria bacterium]MBW2121934.1 bifunctional adenosylcobinamide kinase/adenosylcobinamide-phosphate guanylyltransferase [Deltaproteobacteria bacterium]